MPTANADVSLHPGFFPRLAALNNTLSGKLLLALCGSGFVALCAHISVPLPFTPVPLTFSDFAVLLVGLTLGPATGFAALALYLGEGACGLPVFNPGGAAGLAHLRGFTAGYLLAYPFAAFIAGRLYAALAKFSSRFLAALTASTVATTLIMVCGTLWLGIALHLTPLDAIVKGAAPFLPGQVVKVCAAAGMFASLDRWRRA